MFDAWKERQRQRLKNRPERTVFYNIFATMMLVLVVELLMAAASILAVNVTGQLDKNAKDLLTMRVRNRASYVQEILRNAEDLEQLSEQITATTQQLLKSGDISLDTLDNSSEQSDALLVALAPQLLDTLRTKQVTGIFIMLNTHDLDTCEVGKKNARHLPAGSGSGRPPFGAQQRSFAGTRQRHSGKKTGHRHG